MAIAQVGTIRQLRISSAPGTTSSIDSTGATLLTCMTARHTGGDSHTITDSNSNTWTAIGTEMAAGGTPGVRCWYVANPTVGAGHTFTIPILANNIFINAVFCCWSGTATVSPFDQSNGAGSASSGDPAQPGSITPTEDGELVLTMAAEGPNTSATISGYTILGRDAQIGGTSFGASYGYQVQTTATATNPAWTFGTSPFAINVGVWSFKSATVAGYIEPAIMVLPRLAVHRSTFQ